MAIKVNLQSTIIPVEIGHLKFEINITDKKYEDFVKEFNQFLSNLEKLDEQNAEDVDRLRAMIKEIYTKLLGEGSFEVVYQEMPNIALVASTFINVVTQLMQEMDKRMNQPQKLKTVAKKAPKKQVKK